MSHCIGIILQASANRYGRERIDLPLAFASMELPVKVFLLGDALYDLYPDQVQENGWSKLWAMLIELGAEVCIPAESELAMPDKVTRSGLRVTAMSNLQLATAMAGCQHLLHG